MPHGKEVFHAGNANLGQLHESRWQWLEQVAGPAVALPTEYPDGYRVPQHRHSRSQLLHALVGVVLPFTPLGSILGFTPLPLRFFLILLGMTVGYVVVERSAAAWRD